VSTHRQLSKCRQRATTAVATTVLGLLVSAPLATAAPLPDPDPAPSGGSPGWETLADECFDEVMASCDRLADQTRYANAPIYHDYGFTCGGRVTYDPSSAEDDYNTCVDQYGLP
jgi:hypothetical protein